MGLVLQAILNMPYPDDPSELDVVTWVQAVSAMRTAWSEIERLSGTLAEQSMDCTCHEAYSGRGMQDPDCRAGEYGDDCQEAENGKQKPQAF